MLRYSQTYLTLLGNIIDQTLVFLIEHYFSL